MRAEAKGKASMATDGDHPLRQQWRPAARDMAEATAIPHLASTHCLPSDESLWVLFETVRQYATRDHTRGRTDRTFLINREDAYRDVQAIVYLANEVKVSLASLRAAIAKFSSDFEYDPVLMEAILSLNVGPPSQIVLAPELGLLAGFAKDRHWVIVEKQVEGIRNLPVRRGRPRGRVAPRTLQKCVAACRVYWEHLARTWKPESLADPAVRADNDPNALTGECERFVCDMMRAAGMEHTLEQLSTAMNKRKKAM